MNYEHHQKGNAPLAGEANREAKLNEQIIEVAEKLSKSNSILSLFGELAPVLAQMGYDPVPILPGTKRPRPKNWQDGGFVEQSADFATDYTGILTKYCPAIDIDVSDKRLVFQILTVVAEVTKSHPSHLLSRTGSAPRLLVLFRTDQPFPKVATSSCSLVTNPIIDGKEKLSRVEILGEGQQFVAYAIHPDTKLPYKWSPAGNPTNVARDDLPVLTWENAQEIVRRCEQILSANGTRVGRAKITDVTPTAHISNAELKADDPEVCKSALAAIPNNDVDFDEWVGLLYAAKAALGDDGRSAFLQFSRKSELKHDEEHAKSTWAKAMPTKCGAGSIYYLARQHGWQDPRRVASIDDFVVVEPEPGARAPLPAFKRLKNGDIKPTKENIAIALRRPDVCGCKLRYDVFRGEVMLALPGTEEWRSLKDTDYTWLCINLEHRNVGFKDIAKERIRDAVAYVAEGDAFDSAQYWLRSLKWDGKERVATFLYTYFGTPDSPYARAISQYLWSALAGRVMSPGIKADMVPVAVGAQGKGKSSTIKAIAPAAEHFLELDIGGKEDDMARMMLGKLVVELGELKGLRTREVEHIKSFITRSHEEWVPKFKEMKVAYPRRSIFFGSTNKQEFLQDESGHRRWLPFEVGVCAPELLRADRDQLWAEGLAMFNLDGIRWQEAERLAGAQHDNFVVRDAWEELVGDWLQQVCPLTGRLNGDTVFSAVDILLKVVKMDAKSITQAHKDRMARVLKELGYEPTRERVNGIRKRAYKKST